MDKHLHIICLDSPWPADCGGTIDTMNRIRFLHQEGISIHLHYFSNLDQGIPNELNQFCESIDVYAKEPVKKSFSFRMPFLASFRMNSLLTERLNKDDYPILLEGVPCIGILQDLNVSQRKIVVRIQNKEKIHCGMPGGAESSFAKRLRLLKGTRLLKKHYHHLPGECSYACVSGNDVKALHNNYHFQNVFFLPAFPTWQKVAGEEGQGNFCLYHGDLSVPENEKAALWLLCNVVTKARTPFIIAGKKPSKRLLKVAELCQHTCVVADPSETEMNDLVRKAHIHVLPCFNKQATGIRLKLLHALFEGRHCVVNEPMVEGTGLEEACHIGSSANAMASIIMQLYHQPFTREEKVLRRQLLGSTYDNLKNTRELIQWLW